MPGIAVIIGAGASYDCADDKIGTVDNGYRPPLVNELFLNRKQFNAILAKYPKAEALSPQIRDSIATGRGLEDILKELSKAPQPEVRNQYFQVPLYLQEMIGEVGQHYITGGATRFDTLVRAIAQSDYDNILYITVNYDLFLERALKNLYDVNFNNVADYCKDGRKWVLVKLHGSVTWGRRLLNGKVTNHDSPFAVELSGDPELDEDIIVLDGYQGSHRLRGSEFYYPSLAVPIGEKEFACPEEHGRELMRRIRDCKAALLIGFSALDSDVVMLLAAMPQITRIGVVNGRLEDGKVAIRRCADHNTCFARVVPEDVVYAMGFGEFVRSGKLVEFLRVPT